MKHLYTVLLFLLWVLPVIAGCASHGQRVACDRKLMPINPTTASLERAARQTSGASSGVLP